MNEHASNLFHVKCRIPEQKEELLEYIRKFMEESDEKELRRYRERITRVFWGDIDENHFSLSINIDSKCFTLEVDHVIICKMGSLELGGGYKNAERLRLWSYVVPSREKVFIHCDKNGHVDDYDNLSAQIGFHNMGSEIIHFSNYDDLIKNHDLEDIIIWLSL